jgi:predicted AlkP superfamily pyrophosphatase or phosphodiesterase
LAFSSDLKKAIDFVDASLGLVVKKLKAKGLYEDTLIIVASKHGQAPIDPAKFTKVNPDNFTNLIGVKTDHITVSVPILYYMLKLTPISSMISHLSSSTQLPI